VVEVEPSSTDASQSSSTPLQTSVTPGFTAGTASSQSPPPTTPGVEPVHCKHSTYASTSSSISLGETVGQVASVQSLFLPSQRCVAPGKTVGSVSSQSAAQTGKASPSAFKSSTGTVGQLGSAQSLFLPSQTCGAPV